MKHRKSSLAAVIVSILLLAAVLTGMALFSAADNSLETRYASDMRDLITCEESGWEGHPPTYDKDLFGGRIGLAGGGNPVYYDKGIVAHASSRIDFNVKGLGVIKFSSYIGIEDYILTDTYASSASASFIVEADGVQLIKSDVFTIASSIARLEVMIPMGTETVSLITDAGSSNYADHTAWADAKFTFYSGNEDIMVDAAAELSSMYISEAEPAAITVTGITLSGRTIPGDQLDISCSSSNEDVAKVSNDGTVTAGGRYGRAKITVTVKGEYSSKEITLVVYNLGGEMWDNGTVVIAGSDFQHKGGNAAGQAMVTNIFSAMEDDNIYRADGLLFCGDYDVDTIGNAAETLAGVNAFKAVASEMVDPVNLVLAQGNHDVYAGSGLSPSGNNDPQSGEYGVFVIHNKDYMWYNNDEATVKRTAQNLIDYLNEKLAEGFDKPIFVVSHLALHYSMRTKLDGDGQYANYIFNALNEAGRKGLNIVFLFGHNHSNGWDDYLGGGSVYLKKGDSILIAQADRNNFKNETLTFTYMNAGYVGYYNDHNGLDSSLSMTAFQIKDGEVTVKRYSTDGPIDLKNAGAANAYQGESGYSPNTTVYASPQTVSLTKVSDKTPIDDLLAATVKEGKQYTRIGSVSELQSGEKYLFIYAGSPTSLMIPTAVTKSSSSGSSRIGFDLQSVSEFGNSIAYGKYTDAEEWTLTSTTGGWLLGNEKGYVKFTNTSSTGITATLEDEGDVFTISGSDSLYTFTSGEFKFNYNDRGLINGFRSNPASFYIYKFTGYSTVSVKNGKVQAANAGDMALDGRAVLVKAGALVTLKPADAPEGMEFNKWNVLKGDVTLSDAKDAAAAFTMPANGVNISASYKKTGVPGDPDSCDLTGDGKLNIEDVTLLILYLQNPSAVTLFGDPDLTGDGAVTIKDASRLLQCLENL